MCLYKILRITWQAKVPNNDVLLRAGIPFMFTLLSQARRRRHPQLCFKDGCKPALQAQISKSRPLATFNCKKVTIIWLLPEFWSPKLFSTRHGDQNGRSLERCKRQLNSCTIDTMLWEALADERNPFFDLKSCNIDTKVWEALADNRKQFFSDI